jgi:amino acid transporter
MYQSISHALDVDMGFWPAYACKSFIAVAFALPNLLAVREIGPWMGALAVFVCLPFLAFVIIGAPQVSLKNLVAMRHGTGHSSGSGDFSALDFLRSQEPSDWRHLLSVLYWSYSGFDGVSTCAGEVANPARSLPRGLFAALIIVVLVTVLPLAVAAGVDKPPWWSWESGSFAVIADRVGGHWLGAWVLVASVAGCLGLYVSEMFTDSWQLLGMAECGLAPRIFARRHPRYGTPVNAVLLSLAIILLLVFLEFDAILTVDNFFSCASTFLEVLAYARLRSKMPGLPRPYRAPVEGTLQVAALLAFPLALSCFILVNEATKSRISLAINSAFLAFGVLLYALFKPLGRMSYKSPRHRPHQTLRSISNVSIESLALGSMPTSGSGGGDATWRRTSLSTAVGGVNFVDTTSDTVQPGTSAIFLAHT